MRAWIVWSVGLLAYIVAVLDRTTLGVSGLQAANRFGVSPGVLSSFVVLQVVVYAAAQVPAGVLLDKFGPKTLIATGGALMAAGQLTLAFTTSLPEAIGARATGSTTKKSTSTRSGEILDRPPERVDSAPQALGLEFRSN